MMNAAVWSGLAENTTSALPKLHAWSKIVKDDFHKGNLERDESVEGHNEDLVCHHSLSRQMEKLNQEVARLIHAKSETQAQLLQITQ